MPTFEQKGNPIIGRPLQFGQADPSTLQTTGHSAGPLDLLRASFRQDNVVGSYLNQEPNLPSPFQIPNAKFDQFSLIKGTQYDPMLFINANSPQQVDAIKRQVDKRQADLKTLQEGGAVGFAAGVASGLIDPTSLLLPGSFLAQEGKQGVNLLKAAGRAAGIGALDMTANELMLHATQRGRTAEESAFNIGSGAFIMGLFGGGHAHWSRNWHTELPGISGKPMDNLKRTLEQEMVVDPSTWGVQSSFKSAKDSADFWNKHFGDHDMLGETKQLLRDAEQRMKNLSGQDDVVEAQRVIGQEVHNLRDKAAELQRQIDDATLKSEDELRRLREQDGSSETGNRGDSGSPTGRPEDEGGRIPNPARTGNPEADGQGSQPATAGRGSYPSVTSHVPDAHTLSADDFADKYANGKRGTYTTNDGNSFSLTQPSHEDEGLNNAFMELMKQRGVERKAGENNQTYYRRIIEYYVKKWNVTQDLVIKFSRSKSGATLSTWMMGGQPAKFQLTMHPDLPPLVLRHELEHLRDKLAHNFSAKNPQPMYQGRGEHFKYHSGDFGASYMHRKFVKEALYDGQVVPDHALSYYDDLRRFQIENDQKNRFVNLDNPEGDKLNQSAKAVILKDLSRQLAAAADELEHRSSMLKDVFSLRELLRDIDNEIRPTKRSLLDPNAELPQVTFENPALKAGETEPDVTTESVGMSEDGTMPAEGKDGEPKKSTYVQDDDYLKDHGIISKLLGVNQQDPLIRTLLSKAQATRRAVGRLAENPLKLIKNVAGAASHIPAEVRARMDMAGLYLGLSELDRQFIKYRTGKAKGLLTKGILDIEDATGRNGDFLTRQQFKDEVGKALRRNGEHEIPEVSEAAFALRQHIFDPLGNKAVRLGQLTAEAMNGEKGSYFTRVYDIEKIKAQTDQFTAMNYLWLQQKERQKAADIQRQLQEIQDSMRTASEDEKLELAARQGGLIEQAKGLRQDDELKDVARQVVDRIVGSPVGRLPYDIKLPGKRGFSMDDLKGKPLLARVYDIPDSLIEDWLVNDAEKVARIYNHHMSPYLALTEEFGDASMQKELKAIEKEWDARIAEATTEKERKSLWKQKHQDMADVEAMRDRILGIYALPDNPDALAPRAAKFLKNFNFIRTMGGVTISSIADLGRPMMVMGLRSYLEDGLKPLLKNLKAVQLSGEETKMAGTALDLVLNSRMANLSEVFDDYGRGTIGERMLADMSQGFSRVAGFTHWNSALKQFSGMMIQTNMMHSINRMMAGTETAKDIANLAASYIDRDMALRIAVQFEEHGKMMDGVAVANTSAWTDPEAVMHYRAAINRDVTRVIVEPGQDKPLWLSTPMGSVIGQFKSFFFASMQRVVLSGVQERDMNTLSGLVFMVGLGSATGMIKAAQAGRPYSMSPDDVILDGIDRSGVTGWLFDANHMVETLTRHHIGINALRGKKISDRYASRNFMDAVLGPTAGSLQDAATVVGTVNDAVFKGEAPKQSEIRAFRRIMPYQNLFYLRHIFDAGEQGLAEHFGVESRDNNPE